MNSSDDGMGAAFLIARSALEGHFIFANFIWPRPRNTAAATKTQRQHTHNKRNPPPPLHLASNSRPFASMNNRYWRGAISPSKIVLLTNFWIRHYDDDTSHIYYWMPILGDLYIPLLYVGWLEHAYGTSRQPSFRLLVKKKNLWSDDAPRSCLSSDWHLLVLGTTGWFGWWGSERLLPPGQSWCGMAHVILQDNIKIYIWLNYIAHSTVKVFEIYLWAV